jgi:hypothetical protein
VSKPNLANKEKYKYLEFGDWFNENVGFALRSEYLHLFLDSINIDPVKKKMKIGEYMKAAFDAAREKEN